MTRRRATSRRARAWRWAAGVLAVLLVPVVGFAGWLYADSGRGNLGELSFANRLHIPPLLDPQVGPDEAKRFDLTLQAGHTSLLPGAPDPHLGNQRRPPRPHPAGPPRRPGRHHRDQHPPRGHQPALARDAAAPAADGGPHQTIAPGSTWSPSWRIDQPAATLWYHPPHLHGTTAAHVYLGLAGLFLLDDPQAGRLALPDRYGVDDIPLIL